MIPNKPYDLSIFKEQKSYTVDYNALNTFIDDVYQLTGFEGTLESSNDTTHEYTVSKKLDAWHADDVKSILDDGDCSHWQLGTMLDDMCSMEIIPEGTYYVRVCW